MKNMISEHDFERCIRKRGVIMRFRKDTNRYQESNYGNCPVCGYTDGYVNISCNHWFVCHQHKTKWFVGSNLFSDWQTEREVDWLGNAVLLEQYRDVQPRVSKQPFLIVAAQKQPYKPEVSGKVM